MTLEQQVAEMLRDARVIIGMIENSHILSVSDLDRKIKEVAGLKTDHHAMAVFNIVMNNRASDALFVDVIRKAGRS